ncbi:Zinc finger BED domain-containing protein DAYSLEEPER [Abeliophyllum distichum]|uniref:Zinc finger BED domain-containing protein DAYSLEEPER n=1 Tax=Abeliophyllum distichum TaxID=126358 RepID=A0ABD1SBB5_9LAMI
MKKEKVAICVKKEPDPDSFEVSNPNSLYSNPLSRPVSPPCRRQRNQTPSHATSPSVSPVHSPVSPPVLAHATSPPLSSVLSNIKLNQPSTVSHLPQLPVTTHAVVSTPATRRKVVGWGNDGCPLDGRYLHLRCCAHIINLIVCDGLREAHDSIVGIRNAVKCVKSSPARWNSTYLMLETALKFQKTFDRLEEDDAQYLNYFREDEGGRRRGGPPSSSDWENASVFVKFLKNFFNVTLTFSTSLNVNAPTYLHEISNLVIELDQWSLSSDFLLGEMASNMKKKFDKYWDKMDNVNQLLLVATILDPRYKLDYVEYCFVDIYKNVEVASSMTKMLKANLMSIYEWYLKSEGVSGSNEVTNEATSSSFNSDKGSSCCSTSEARLSRCDEKQTEKNLTDIKNDVERYLLDARESVKNKDFDVLNWWKVNKSKYGILSNIARDVLAIHVSTVASESAFSTGGRILDPFRSSLSPKIVEVLICTQNWLKASPNLDGFFMEDIKHCNQLEAKILELMNSKSTEDIQGPKAK